MNLDEDDRQLALDILGTDQTPLIESAINAFCREHFGHGVARVHYTSFSVGAGFGLSHRRWAISVYESLAADNVGRVAR